VSYATKVQRCGAPNVSTGCPERHATVTKCMHHLVTNATFRKLQRKRMSLLHMRDTGLSFTATIRASDGVRFTATSATRELLMREIAAYVVSRCDYVLWAADACRVHAFIDTGEPDAAINLYFARVGERWDEERLEIASRPLSAHASHYELHSHRGTVD
jgi:hypothetical protein